MKKAFMVMVFMTVVFSAVTGAQQALEGFVYITPGTFEMGSNDGDSDEKPVHTVTLTKGFYMQAKEVTQSEYESVMGTNPSNFKGGNLPVEQVSWYEAVQYCNKRSEREGLRSCYRISGSSVSWDETANGYRLPTEAEWEYVARGGAKSKGYNYSGSTNLDEVGWYDDNSGFKTHPVGQKMANELGMYDMSGNVWEWCWDWYGSYPSGSVTNPKGIDNGSFRVLRGGSWFNLARVAGRRFGTGTRRPFGSTTWAYASLVPQVNEGVIRSPKQPERLPKGKRPYILISSDGFGDMIHAG